MQIEEENSFIHNREKISQISQPEQEEVSYSNRALAATSSSNGALGEGSEGWGRFLGVIGSSQARQAPSPSPLGARGVIFRLFAYGCKAET